MDTKELAESIIRGMMFLAGILGNNYLAARSFPTQRTSIRTNEVLFINLAVSNLITNYLVDLPDTMADFAGRWFLGETYCGIFRFCADLSETSSIFTTLFISVFWHQKLVGSLRRGGAPVQMDNLCLVACLLAGSWTVAAVFSVPHFFFVKVEATNESSEDCIDVFPNKLAKQTYEIIYLTLANIFPVAGIVFASMQIVVTLLQNQRRIQSHSSNPTQTTNRTEDRSSCTSGKDSTLTSPVYTGVPPVSADGGALAQSSGEPQPGGTARSHQECPRPGQAPTKPTLASGSQVRAAKSVVAVASVFLVCWLTHLLLRISNNVHTSSVVVEVASYIAASYTCIIPYIFLHGVKKLYCSCKR
ncbi:unnamed protein product [Tetraodon nigroviridis]|uniref:(spotted green pufferfish) hypothetical protein n=1 Tax=Tetraodon nigroviridis TaxID=99883 RepID=Q4SJG8_TETNG|nr:unnamed protein product [Tetraodon nigroviridis]